MNEVDVGRIITGLVIFLHVFSLNNIHQHLIKYNGKIVIRDRILADEEMYHIE